MNDKPDMNLTGQIIKGIKSTFEKYFGAVYIEKKEIVSEENISTTSVGADELNLFLISKNNEPIYKQVNSVDDLTKIKDEISKEYKNLVNDYWELYDRVESDLDPQVARSLEIIGKTLENRDRKLSSDLKKLKVDDSWNIDDIQKEFSRVLQKRLKDILESTMPSIHIGIKSLDIYDKVLEILNHFYASLGIYTKDFSVGDSVADQTDFIEPMPMENEEVKDKSYQDKIAKVESVAYLFDEDLVILEAKVFIWRVS